MLGEYLHFPVPQWDNSDVHFVCIHRGPCWTEPRCPHRGQLINAPMLDFSHFHCTFLNLTWLPGISSQIKNLHYILPRGLFFRRIQIRTPVLSAVPCDGMPNTHKYCTFQIIPQWLAVRTLRVSSLPQNTWPSALSAPMEEKNSVQTNNHPVLFPPQGA